MWVIDATSISETAWKKKLVPLKETHEGGR